VIFLLALGAKVLGLGLGPRSLSTIFEPCGLRSRSEEFLCGQSRHGIQERAQSVLTAQAVKFLRPACTKIARITLERTA
jgi:hypothetical protein